MKQFSPNKKTMKNVHMSCLGFSPKNDARVKPLIIDSSSEMSLRETCESRKELRPTTVYNSSTSLQKL